MASTTFIQIENGSRAVNLALVLDAEWEDGQPFTGTLVLVMAGPGIQQAFDEFVGPYLVPVSGADAAKVWNALFPPDA